jgi:murein DD-endopeptidase MepM/ murein hydrolase activator NlpD
MYDNEAPQSSEPAAPDQRAAAEGLASGNIDASVTAEKQSASTQLALIPAKYSVSGRYAAARNYIKGLDWTPDLGRNIGSLSWLRGVATLCILSLVALSFWPDFSAIKARTTAPLTIQEFDEWRTQRIAPLALGGDVGRKMGATSAVVPLTASPERPNITLSATLNNGDSFARVLRRAGVGRDQANAVTQLVSKNVALSDIEPGTNLDIVLGRRPSRNVPRPLENLAFRARFNLNLKVTQGIDGFTITRQPIIVDDTPLRLRGTVGNSLYRSARAAGAPPRAVQEYLKTLATKISVGRDIAASDEFDFVIAYKRAETGERQVGKLLYAAVHRADRKMVEMMSWEKDGRLQWFDPKGVGEQRGELARPVNAKISSGFGLRRHPILGYRRMHSGLDFSAGYGAPIYAATDGRVTYAGRKGGYGKFVKLKHAGSLATGYAHMSRIAVRSGQRVRRGQIIGYVGSTGLSTGPHLHYELYRNGRAINPQSVRFTTRAQLSGEQLARFRARREMLLSLEPGNALTPLAPPPIEQPEREIERLTGKPDRKIRG